MELIKWFVKLGEYGEYIADGYAYAERREILLKALKEKYNNAYHNIQIEDDWSFDEEDIKDLDSLPWEVICECKIAVRWED